MYVRDILSGRRGLAPLLGLALLLSMTLGLTSEARAQRRNNPVQALEQALDKPVDKAATRKEELKKLTANLRSLGDMAQALLLNYWGDDHPLRGLDETELDQAKKDDTEIRQDLLKRFLQGIKDVVEKGGPASQSAAATLVGEFAASARGGVSARSDLGDLGGRNRTVLSRLPDFAAPLATLAEKDKDVEVRAAAARALARLRSDHKTTAAALEAMLKDGNPPEVRQAAAAALDALFQGIQASDRGGLAAVVVEPSPRNLIEFGQVVARAAGASLADRDVAVRRSSAAALLQAGSVLNAKLSGGGERKDLEPVVTDLWGQAAALSGAANDADPEVRYRARRALETLGEIRLRWLHPEVLTIPPEKLGKPPKPLGAAATPEELTGLSLVSTVGQEEPAKPDLAKVPGEMITALVRGLQDPDVRNRLAAVDALEALMARPEGRTVAEEFGTDAQGKPTREAKAAAKEAGRGLVRALSDPDRFVRWAASRTLGRMAPLKEVAQPDDSWYYRAARALGKMPPLKEDELKDVERGAVTGLARVLSDSDPDVRLRAARALERFGDAARPAVPALARASVRGDVEARIVATRAIETIGGSPDAAVPALAISLADQNVRLRRAAAEALAAYGADALAAKPALERALLDPDPEVRRGASDALLEIGGGK
jgi:HEAT repeat protein